MASGWEDQRKHYGGRTGSSGFKRDCGTGRHWGLKGQRPSPRVRRLGGKIRPQSSKLLYYKIKICQAVNKWFGCRKLQRKKFSIGALVCAGFISRLDGVG